MHDTKEYTLRFRAFAASRTSRPKTPPRHGNSSSGFVASGASTGQSVDCLIAASPMQCTRILMRG